MAFKFVLFAAFIAIVKAGNLGLAPAPFATAYQAAPIARIATPVFTQRLAPQVLATPIAHSIAPVAPIAKTVVDTDFDPNPQYSFAYDINDALTGDSKNHFESRSGDVVQGQYSLADSDGTRRTVEYTADPINGFNAVVHREPLIAAAPVAKIATPIATPFAAPFAAPIGNPFAAPIAARHILPFH